MSNPKRNLPNILKANEIDSLIVNAPNSRAVIAMELQWWAGLSVSEVVQLKVCDINLSIENPVLRTHRPGGTSLRFVPIPPTLRSSLETRIFRRKLRESHPIIGVSRQKIWTWYKQALNKCVELNLLAPDSYCGTHTLRHSAAKRWADNGVHVNQISAWLGHKDMATTLKYVDDISNTGRP